MHVYSITVTARCWMKIFTLVWIGSQSSWNEWKTSIKCSLAISILWITFLSSWMIWKNCDGTVLVVTWVWLSLCPNFPRKSLAWVWRENADRDFFLHFIQIELKSFTLKIISYVVAFLFLSVEFLRPTRSFLFNRYVSFKEFNWLCHTL